MQSDKVNHLLVQKGDHSVCLSSGLVGVTFGGYAARHGQKKKKKKDETILPPGKKQAMQDKNSTQSCQGVGQKYC